MKKGMKKCNKCGTVKKGYKGYKKKSKWFCTKKCKREYYDTHLPTQKKKTQRMFNKFVAKDQHCARCGKKFETMQASHVYTVGAYDNLRFDILNALPMDGGCHNYWWHQEPLEAFAWFKDTYPERYEYLQFAKNQTKKWTIDELKQIQKAIKEEKPRELIRFREEYGKHKRGV